MSCSKHQDSSGYFLFERMAAKMKQMFGRPNTSPLTSAVTAWQQSGHCFEKTHIDALTLEPIEAADLCHIAHYDSVARKLNLYPRSRCSLVTCALRKAAADSSYTLHTIDFRDPETRVPIMPKDLRFLLTATMASERMERMCYDVIAEAQLCESAAHMVRIADYITAIFIYIDVYQKMDVHDVLSDEVYYDLKWHFTCAWMLPRTWFAVSSVSLRTYIGESSTRLRIANAIWNITKARHCAVDVLLDVHHLLTELTHPDCAKADVRAFRDFVNANKSLFRLLWCDNIALYLLARACGSPIFTPPSPVAQLASANVAFMVINCLPQTHVPLNWLKEYLDLTMMMMITTMTTPPEQAPLFHWYCLQPVHAYVDATTRELDARTHCLHNGRLVQRTDFKDCVADWIRCLSDITRNVSLSFDSFEFSKGLLVFLYEKETRVPFNPSVFFG